MVHYNDIQEGQTVKYYGHTCKVADKAKTDDCGMYVLTLTYPNALMIDVTCIVQSNDGNFKDVEA